MAYNNYNNNNDDRNDKKFYQPQLYSECRISNADGVDPSRLSFYFFGGMVKIGISPLLKTVPNEQGGDPIHYWDDDNMAFVWLRREKARMFVSEIKMMLKDPDKYTNVGVGTGKAGWIGISTGTELGTDSYCLVIRKVSDTNTLAASYAYQFKTGHHYAIRNFDKDTCNFEKAYYDELEIYELIDLLEDFYKGMLGSRTYTSLYYGRFNESRTDTKLKLIMDNLGIEQKSGQYSNSGRSGGSWFNSQNAEQHQVTTPIDRTSLDNYMNQPDEELPFK